MEPVGDFLRIYEHSIEEDEEAKGESIIRMKLVKKVFIPNMSEIEPGRILKYLLVFYMQFCDPME